MNPIFEIRRKIEEFERLTGLRPNVILVSRYIDKRINLMLKDRTKLIEFYPEVFQLSFRVTQKIKGVEVQLVLA